MEMICVYPRRRQKRRLACVKTRQSRQRWYVNFPSRRPFLSHPPFQRGRQKAALARRWRKLLSQYLCFVLSSWEMWNIAKVKRNYFISLTRARCRHDPLKDIIGWFIAQSKSKSSRVAVLSVFPHRSDYWHKVRLCWRNMAQGKRTFIYCSRINNSRANFHDTPVDSLPGFGWSSRCLNDRKIVHNYFRSGI